MKAERAILIVIVWAAIQSTAIAQIATPLDSTDFRLLRQVQPSHGEKPPRQVSYGFTPGKCTFNPFYHLLSASMFAYQKVISPVIARHCAYSPTCSAYSKELIREYGLAKGICLTADRLTRCTRIALTGADTYFLIDEGHGHIQETPERYRP